MNKGQSIVAGFCTLLSHTHAVVLHPPAQEEAEEDGEAANDLYAVNWQILFVFTEESVGDFSCVQPGKCCRPAWGPWFCRGGGPAWTPGRQPMNYFSKCMSFFKVYIIFWGSWEMKVLKKECVRKLAVKRDPLYKLIAVAPRLLVTLRCLKKC